MPLELLFNGAPEILMRILQVTQAYYPFLERGGPAVKVRAMTLGLARRGHSVTVLTADLGLRAFGNADGLTQSRWGWRVQQDAIETVYLRSLAAYRALTMNPDIGSFCRERLEAFDIVHVYGIYDLLGPFVTRACRRLGVPYVIEPMGMFRPIIRNIPLKRVYRYALGNSMVLAAKRVIATSAQEQRELVEEGVPPQRIVVRRNGIEAPEHLPAKGAFRQLWHISESAKVVLFLGRLVTKKSPELLIEAFARWKSTQSPRPSRASAVLLLAGPLEEDAYLAKLKNVARQFGVEDQVLFTGPLYDDAKWSAYRDSDLFVLPSQNENFGNTAAEAVVCGIPVLVTDRCGIAPLIDGRAGIVISHDVQRLTAALTDFFADEDLRSRLRAGCSEASGDLTWDQPLDETEALYASLLQESKRIRS